MMPLANAFAVSLFIFIFYFFFVLQSEKWTIAENLIRRKCTHYRKRCLKALIQLFIQKFRYKVNRNDIMFLFNQMIHFDARKFLKGNRKNIFFFSFIRFLQFLSLSLLFIQVFSDGKQKIYTYLFQNHDAYFPYNFIYLFWFSIDNNIRFHFFGKKIKLNLFINGQRENWKIEFDENVYE